MGNFVTRLRLGGWCQSLVHMVLRRLSLATLLRMEESLDFMHGAIRSEISRRVGNSFYEKTTVLTEPHSYLNDSHFEFAVPVPVFLLTFGNIYAFDDVSNENFVIRTEGFHLLLFCNSVRIVDRLTDKLVGWRDLYPAEPVFIQTLAIPVTSGVQFRTCSFDTDEISGDHIRSVLEAPPGSQLKCMLCIAYCGLPTLAKVASNNCRVPVMNVSCHQFGVGDLNQVSKYVGLFVYGNRATFVSIFNVDLQEASGSERLHIKVMHLIEQYCNGLIVAFTSDVREPIDDVGQDSLQLATQQPHDLVEKFLSRLAWSLPDTVKLVEFTSTPDLDCFNLPRDNRNTTSASICQIGMMLCFWN